MIKLLAWQRIQQLFPPKAPSPQTSVSPTPALKSPPALPDSEPPAAPARPASVGADLKLKLSFTGQKKVQARAVFYPLTGKGQAVNMCYRTLYIGSGEAPPRTVRMSERRRCFADATVFCFFFKKISPEGADMDVCLTNYGHCNYISGKHACIFYDEARCC